MRAMQPVTDEFFSGHAFALCDFRFVMREDIIDAAAMDIDLITQQRSRHRAALDVPAGPARSPWRGPFYVAVFFVPRFPTREIPAAFLVAFVMLHAPCRLQLRAIDAHD